MKKKFLITKKVLAAALSAAMVLSMAACGNEDGGNTSSENNNTQQNQTEDNSSETPSDDASSETPDDTPEEPQYDFGGRTLRIGSYYDMTPDPTASALKAALAERIAYVEENYNCTIEFVNLGDDYMDQYVRSVLAGDPVVDIGYGITWRVLPALIEGGIVYPVSDLSTIDLNDYKWRADVTEAGYYKGKNYTFLLNDPEIRYGIFWNKTLFDQYGLPDLYELVDNDEWTWEKFKEIAATAGQDTDSDGTIDIHGFAASGNLSWNYLYSNGAYVAEKTESGLDIDLSDPAVVEALSALQDFTTTVTYRNSIDWSTEQWNAMITGFRDGDTMMLLEEYWISYAYLENADTPMSDDWGWVPFPKGPSATDWSSYGKEHGARVMLNGIDDPEEAALIYDLITDIADTNEEWDDYVEDVLENWSNDAKTVELVSYIYNNGLGVINSINGFTDLNNAINEMFGKVTSGEMTPQTALDTYQSQIDAAIADLDNYDYDAEMQSYLETEDETEGEESEGEESEGDEAEGEDAEGEGEEEAEE